MEGNMAQTNELVAYMINTYSWLQMIKANNKNTENAVLDYAIQQTEKTLHSLGVNTESMKFQEKTD